MKKYHVTADVNSKKYGKGQLIAELNEAEFIEYANLSDEDKLAFLRDKGARFQVDMADLAADEVVNFQIKPAGPEPSSPEKTVEPQVQRKMRMNINGQDTGWVDVTEENQAQYDELMDHFNHMHQEFNQRFGDFFQDFRPGRFLDHWPKAFTPGLEEPKDKEDEQQDQD